MNCEGTSIIRAGTAEDLVEIRALFLEYEAFLNVDLEFQHFESELSGLPGKYAPPDGALLLAVVEDNAVGCGGLRRFGYARERICEMKRLYVRPEARGRGIGRRLARGLIEEGGRLGYSTMVLDTLDRLETAMILYESLGFIRTKPYYDNPLPGVVYWKLDLEKEKA